MRGHRIFSADPSAATVIWRRAVFDISARGVSLGNERMKRANRDVIIISVALLAFLLLLAVLVLPIAAVYFSPD
jgi:hypothetical protein